MNTDLKSGRFHMLATSKLIAQVVDQGDFAINPLLYDEMRPCSHILLKTPYRCRSTADEASEPLMVRRRKEFWELESGANRKALSIYPLST